MGLIPTNVEYALWYRHPDIWTKGIGGGGHLAFQSLFW